VILPVYHSWSTRRVSRKASRLRLLVPVRTMRLSRTSQSRSVPHSPRARRPKLGTLAPASDLHSTHGGKASSSCDPNPGTCGYSRPRQGEAPRRGRVPWRPRDPHAPSSRRHSARSCRHSARRLLGTPPTDPRGKCTPLPQPSAPQRGTRPPPTDSRALRPQLWGTPPRTPVEPHSAPTALGAARGTPPGTSGGALGTPPAAVGLRRSAVGTPPPASGTPPSLVGTPPADPRVVGTPPGALHPRHSAPRGTWPRAAPGGVPRNWGWVHPTCEGHTAVVGTPPGAALRARHSGSPGHSALGGHSAQGCRHSAPRNPTCGYSPSSWGHSARRLQLRALRPSLRAALRPSVGTPPADPGCGHSASGGLRAGLWALRPQL
jgi:hypothetical protein